MNEKHSIEERCRKILEDNGGVVANKARTMLLEDPALKDLRYPLEFISKNWLDLTPALISLSCEAVGGRPEKTHDVALAMCLMHLSFYIWDDVIDNARSKSFRPTLFGKFGGGTALIIGGLASAKAFSILNEMPMGRKRQRVSKLIWNLGVKMAQVETITLKLRSKENLSSKRKFWKIKTEAADLETCLKIGAIIGNGSKSEESHLEKYGLYLGIALELSKDFRISVNLTAELAEKIKNGTLPYSTLWASQRSQRIQKKLHDLAGEGVIKQACIKEIVQDTLATKVLDHITKNITRYTQKAKNELIHLKKNNATQTLKSFVDFQPRLFTESLSMFQV